MRARRGKRRREEEAAVRVFRYLRLSLLMGAALIYAVACGAGGPPATGAAPSAGCTGSGGTPVGIADFTFNPRSASAAVNGVVTWANADSAPHTVTFDGGPDCGRLAQGQAVSRTFTTAGTFTYKCTIHPTMTGSVIVQ